VRDVGMERNGETDMRKRDGEIGVVAGIEPNVVCETVLKRAAEGGVVVVHLSGSMNCLRSG